jgi:hypothetical protein
MLTIYLLRTTVDADKLTGQPDIEKSVSKKSKKWAGILLGLQALSLLSAALPAVAATSEIILLQSNVSARRDSLLNNLGVVANSPFDGIVINMPATYTTMLNTQSLDYTSVYNYWLQPLVTTMPKLSNSYLNVNLRDSGDAFGSWATTLENWKVVARAGLAAGMRGIYFDNEPYVEPGAMTYPGNAANPGLGLAAYQEQFRQRGADVMNAIQSVWNSVEVVSLHGPYVSEPTTPNSVRLDQVGADGNDMRGFFFAGMLGAKGPDARVTDGGELYQYRTKEDFENSVAWRRNAMSQIPGGSVVPANLQDAWVSDMGITFGLFDQQWRPNGAYPMTPTILEESIFLAMMNADRPIWLYAEDNDYLISGGVSSEWTDAISRAKARARSAQVPVPATAFILAIGLLVLWSQKRGQRSAIMN